MATKAKTYTYPASKLETLRKKVRKLCPPDEIGSLGYILSPDDPYEARGWHKSPQDPMRLLDAFPTLHIKPGFVLRAYQFWESSGANGVVYAMPVDSPFPEPAECCEDVRHLGPSPRPEGVLPDVMEAVQGDDSPWSYVEAAVFREEIHEFGAYWHGCSWGVHDIIDDKFETRVPMAGRMPRTLKPTVYFGPRVVRVTFYSFTAFYQTSIHRHGLTFGRGVYSPRKGEWKVVAKGEGGILM